MRESNTRIAPAITIASYLLSSHFIPCRNKKDTPSPHWYIIWLLLCLLLGVFIPTTFPMLRYSNSTHAPKNCRSGEWFHVTNIHSFIHSLAHSPYTYICFFLLLGWHIHVIMAFKIAILSMIRCPVVFARRVNPKHSHCIRHSHNTHHHIYAPSKMRNDKRMMGNMFTHISVQFTFLLSRNTCNPHFNPQYTELYTRCVHIVIWTTVHFAYTIDGNFFL